MKAVAALELQYRLFDQHDIDLKPRKSTKLV